MPPADVEVAGGVGVAHRDGIVDQHQLDLEVLAAGRLPDLAGLEAVVGVDDRAPAGPDVDREPDGAIRHRLVAGNALNRRQLGLGNIFVLLGRSDAGGIRRLGPRHFLFADVPGLRAW